MSRKKIHPAEKILKDGAEPLGNHALNKGSNDRMRWGKETVASLIIE